MTINEQKLAKKNAANIDLGGETDWILLQRLFLVLFEWFRSKWPFNTGGRQYKQAVGTYSKVKGYDRLMEVTAQ